MSEWNPKDADAASTRYDLTDWTIDERADVVAALAQAEVAHAWEGDELIVPQDREEVVEDILDELEEQMDANDAEEDADDNITEYELDEWTEGERKQLCEMLDNLDIGYRWDGTVLLVPIGVEAVVDSCLDSIDSRGVEFTEGKQLSEAAAEVLAEVEFWHSRPITPTRRLSLGRIMLPVDPAPGLGGILLGGIIAQFVGDVHEDMIPDVHRLISQVERGERIVQPRLRHRYQADRHGLGRSVHRLINDDNEVQFQFSETGTPLQHVLGAIYVLERLDGSVSKELAPLLLKAMSWRGPLNQFFVSYLTGNGSSTISALTDPRAWALEILGFPTGTLKPSKKEVQTRFRKGLRDVHPDHGGDQGSAGRSIIDLGEARRILLN